MNIAAVIDNKLATGSLAPVDLRRLPLTPRQFFLVTGEENPEVLHVMSLVGMALFYAPVAGVWIYVHGSRFSFSRSSTEAAVSHLFNIAVTGDL